MTVDDDTSTVLVALDPDDHRRVLRLLGTLAELLGQLPDRDGSRYAHGHDLVGAALLVAEQDPEVLGAVGTEIRRRRLRRGARGELLAVCHALQSIGPRLDDHAARQEAERLTRALREVAVAVAVQDDPVSTAHTLTLEAHHLARLAQQAGPWAQPLQDLAGLLDDLQDALRPPTQETPPRRRAAADPQGPGGVASPLR